MREKKPRAKSLTPSVKLTTDVTQIVDDIAEITGCTRPRVVVEAVKTFKREVLALKLEAIERERKVLLAQLDLREKAVGGIEEAKLEAEKYNPFLPDGLK